MGLLSNQIAFSSVIFHIENQILSLSLIATGLKFKSHQMQEKVKEEINKLNNLNQQLREAHKIWKSLDKDILSFQHYEGTFKSSICENSENNKKEICHSKDLVSSQKIQVN